MLYPANELVVTEVALAGQETLGERMEVLVPPVPGLYGRIGGSLSGFAAAFPAFRCEGRPHSPGGGGSHPMEPLVNRLTEIGYERVEMVEKAGEFSVRGGILDVVSRHLRRSGPHRVV